jgi:hypothetical protein
MDIRCNFISMILHASHQNILRKIMFSKFIVKAFFVVSVSSFSISAMANVIICDEGKVVLGDSLEKFNKVCLKANNIKSNSSGMRQVGKNNTVVRFHKFIKTFSNGSSVHFLFLDEKLAFIIQ